MSRYSHDGTCSVIHHYVVGDIDRNFCSVDRIDRVTADEYSGLFLCKRCTFKLGLMSACVHISFYFIFVFSAFSQLRNERMLRRENHVCNSEECIRTCSIYYEFLVCAVDAELDLSTLRTSDPVFLHGFDLVRPARHILKILEESVGVVGDLEIPL